MTWPIAFNPSSSLDDRIYEPYGIREAGRISLSRCQQNREQPNPSASAAKQTPINRLDDLLLENASIESFNGRLRDELLNETIFTVRPSPRRASRLEARLKQRPTAQRSATYSGRIRRLRFAKSNGTTLRALVMLRAPSAPSPNFRLE
jgi:hypothetical protein